MDAIEEEVAVERDAPEPGMLTVETVLPEIDDPEDVRHFLYFS